VLRDIASTASRLILKEMLASLPFRSALLLTMWTLVPSHKR
jgi:hypothetical protein